MMELKKLFVIIFFIIYKLLFLSYFYFDRVIIQKKDKNV